MTKCASGLFVYTHTFARRRSPSASGMRRRRNARTRSSSSARGSRSTRSGSARSPKCRPASFSPWSASYGKPYRKRGEGVPPVARLEPEEHVALDPEMRREVGDEVRHPRAGGEHETRCAIRAARRRDAHAVAVARPLAHRLVEAQLGTEALGEREVRLDAALWSEPSGLDVEEPAPAVVDREQRIAAAKLGVVEQLVGEAMRAGALERAADELAVGPSEEEAAGLREECLAGFALELAPEIPGAAE